MSEKIDLKNILWKKNKTDKNIIKWTSLWSINVFRLRTKI
jgi:hypothetical protein